MANLNTSMKQILKDLEENLKNKEDFEYVKLQIFNLYNMFIEETEKKEDLINKKIKTLTKTQNIVEEKLKYIENHLNNIEKDLYIEDEESDFSITCPYCNHEFVATDDELTDEIECPECGNTIELDWGNDEEGCSGCQGNCNTCNYKDEDDDM